MHAMGISKLFAMVPPGSTLLLMVIDLLAQLSSHWLKEWNLGCRKEMIPLQQSYLTIQSEGG